MSPTRNPGRVAGLLVLLLVVLARYRLPYMPRTQFVRGNVTATANNAAAHESLFRLGIVRESVSGYPFPGLSKTLPAAIAVRQLGK